MFEWRPSRRTVNEMDLFERMAHTFETMMNEEVGSSFGERSHSFKLDVAEEDGQYEVTAELPGFEKDEIDIDVANDYVIIRAQKETTSEEEKEGRIIRRERQSGQLMRRLYVGAIDEENVRAKLKDGLLTITLPKRDGIDGTKRIEIE